MAPWEGVSPDFVVVYLEPKEVKILSWWSLIEEEGKEKKKKREGRRRSKERLSSPEASTGLVLSLGNITCGEDIYLNQESGFREFGHRNDETSVLPLASTDHETVAMDPLVSIPKADTDHGSECGCDDCAYGGQFF
ncbi:uncharacterized protein LOC122091577 [Macadamia integrifolia]|uniref:uncharacterized protein LOC122091577 n=1 Tax=Macadamia integrifolia TaxID=60698 RepID=UPI001C4E667F|nr:uncharacterized protein LOC122091577 [Macadamia integrifolia]